MLPPVLVNVALAVLSIYALRGTFCAPLEEQQISRAVTGTPAGAAPVIGFTPDIYMPVSSGAFLDSSPGLSGYRILFEDADIVDAPACIFAWTLCGAREPSS